MISYHVDGIPAPRSEPRRARSGHLYYPKDDKGQLWRELVLRESLRHAPPAPFDGPVGIELTFRFPKPKSRGPLDPHGWDWCFVKPDSSNVLKVTEDALEKAGMVINDSRLCHHVIAKRYSDRPGVSIAIYEIGG